MSANIQNLKETTIVFAGDFQYFLQKNIMFVVSCYYPVENIVFKAANIMLYH